MQGTHMDIMTHLYTEPTCLQGLFVFLKQDERIRRINSDYYVCPCDSMVVPSKGKAWLCHASTSSNTTSGEQPKFGDRTQPRDNFTIPNR